MTVLTTKEIYLGARKVLAESLGIDEGDESLKLEAKLVEDLGACSLDMLQIGFLVERKFGLQNCRLKASEVPTVLHLVAYVKSRLWEASSPNDVQV